MRLVLFGIAVIAIMFGTYKAHGTEHIVTTDGTCYGRSRYEILGIQDPIKNPFVIEECK
jgi:hypothetical protein